MLTTLADGGRGCRDAAGLAIAHAAYYISAMSATISVADAADILGLTPHGVRYLIRAGRLRAKRIGPAGNRCTYEIRRADLDRIERLPPGRPKAHAG